MSDNPLQPALDAIAARLKADAERIAELEAEVERLDSFDVGLDAALAKLEAENRELQLDLKDVLKKRDLCETRHEQAEAELAALKGRRCETCAERGGPDWNRYVCLLDDNCAADFYCSFWAARAEEGRDDAL
jgi:DNA repair exonuclease SbcCD ATPase subunit